MDAQNQRAGVGVSQDGGIALDAASLVIHYDEVTAALSRLNVGESQTRIGLAVERDAVEPPLI